MKSGKNQEPKFNSERIVLAGLLGIYFTVGIIFNLVFPLGEAPDEPAHFGFVKFVALNGTLPVMRPALEENDTAEAFQAPAYYVLAALLTHTLFEQDMVLGMNPAFSFTRHDPKIPFFYPLPEHRFPWQGNYLVWHLIRFFSLCLGAVSLWATWQTSRLVFNSFWASNIAVAYLVFNPQFVYLHSMVTNDAMATTAGSLIILASLILLKSARLRYFILAALALSLALLSKPSAAVLGSGLILACVFACFRLGTWRQRFFSLFILGAIPLMASGWWFWRNQQLYGDWLGLTVAKQALAANYYVRPLTWKEFIAILGPMFRQTFQSSWGFFGWLSLPLAERAFQIILIVHFLAAVGLILSGKDLEGYLRQMLVLGCAWMSLLASFLYYNLETNSSGWHGRFLFPGIVIGAVAFAGGINGWGRITGKPQMVNWSVMALGLGLVIYALAGVILPLYLPPLTRPLDISVPNPVNAAFQGGIRLVGYEVLESTARPGESFTLKLYWSRESDVTPNLYPVLKGFTLDHRVMTIPTVSPLAIRYPTSIWSRNRIVVDRYKLTTVSTLNQVAGKLYLVVQDAPQDGNPVAHIDETGQELTRELLLGLVAIQAAQKPESLPQNVQATWGDGKILLRGFTISEDETQIRVTLYWEPRQKIDQDYQVFVQVLDQQNRVVAQHDGPPQNGLFPTQVWRPGMVITDTHVLTIPPESDSLLRIVVGLYKLETMERLPVQDADGNDCPDQALLLTAIDRSQ